MPSPEDEEFGTRTVISRAGFAGTTPAADDDRAHYLVVVEG